MIGIDDETWEWSYDDIGNRVAQAGPDPRGYDYIENSEGNNSQLLETDGTYTYHWYLNDVLQNGNLYAKTNGYTWGYFWDEENRLMVQVRSDNRIVAYGYDYTGKRVYKQVSENDVVISEYYYFYDGMDLVKEREVQGGNETIRYYVYAGLDDPLFLTSRAKYVVPTRFVPI